MYTKHVLQSSIATAQSARKRAAYVRLRFTRGISAEMTTILDPYFELESCICLDTSCE